MFTVIFAIIVICVILAAYYWIQEKPEREAKEREEAKQKEEFEKKLKEVWDDV